MSPKHDRPTVGDTVTLWAGFRRATAKAGVPKRLDGVEATVERVDGDRYLVFPGGPTGRTEEPRWVIDDEISNFYTPWNPDEPWEPQPEDEYVKGKGYPGIHFDPRTDEE